MIYQLLKKWLRIKLERKIYSLNKNLCRKELGYNGLYISSSKNIFVTVLTCRTLSESAEILSSINPQLSRILLETIKKSEDFVKNEKLNTGDWNYWSKTSSDYINKPYPSDLDDTFNAHYMLRAVNGNYFNSENLYIITQNLLNTERADGGYNTWIKSDIEDIDPVVQVIVYKLLFKIRSVPDNFKDFLVNRLLVINQNSWKSKYYHSKLYTLSELSSILSTLTNSKDIATKLHNILIHQYKTLSNEPANSKFYNSLLRTQIEINLNIFYTFDTFKLPTVRDFRFRNFISPIYKPIWKIRPEPIFIESIVQGVHTYCYSRAVVLALYIKTLSSILRHISDKNSKSFAIKKEENYKITYNELLSKLHIYSRVDPMNGTDIPEKSHDTEDSDNTESIIRTIFKGDDTLHIVHSELYDFSHGIKGVRVVDCASSINNILNSIYLAMLFGWTAYTTYDSILDKELPATYIPFANRCNLHMLNTLYSQKFIKDSPYVLNFIHEKLIQLNTVGPQILRNSMQSQKSIGHCIGPICIFALLVKKWKGSDMEHLENYYKNYLSLKQLSDDMHDWKEDISAGRKTYVTELIISSANNEDRYISSSSHSAHIEICTDIYTEIFTNSVIFIVHKEMLKQTETALYHLFKIGHHFKPTYLELKIRDTKKYVEGIKQAINEVGLYDLSL